jgi:hypothetical protein
MTVLTGVTEDGQEVPVQVDGAGRLVAEGLTGPAGPAGPAGAPGGKLLTEEEFAALPQKNADDIYYIRTPQWGITPTDAPLIKAVYKGATKVYENRYAAIGFNWEFSNNPPYFWRDVIWANSSHGFLAAGINSQQIDSVASSPDGVHWNVEQLSGSHGLSAIAYDPATDRIVIVNSTLQAAEAWVSTAGSPWTKHSVGIEGTFRHMLYNPTAGLFVAASSAANATPIITSPDGVTWTGVNLGANYLISDIAYSPSLGKFVAVTGEKTSDQMLVSDDCILFTAYSAGFTKEIKGVCWSEGHGKFFANTTNWTGPSLSTSTDGVNWIAAWANGKNDAQNLTALGDTKQLICSHTRAAENTVQVSNDGIHWYTVRCIDNGIRMKFAYSPDLQVAIGAGFGGGAGHLLYSR